MIKVQVKRQEANKQLYNQTQRTDTGKEARGKDTSYNITAKHKDKVHVKRQEAKRQCYNQTQ